MNFSNGRIHRALPGPSIIPEKVLQAMQRPAPNIYGGELEEITMSILSDIAKLADTKGRVALYISNGHGVWEAALANLFNENDKIITISNGVFGKHWGNIASTLGLEVVHLEYGMDRTFEMDDLEKVLAEDKDKKIKGILAVQTDTASSMLLSINEINKLKQSFNHPALLLVDSIACFGCDDMRMDEWGVDLLLTASQKGLMTPPGLGYLIIGERAEIHAKKISKRSAYWDWGPRLDPKNFYEIYFGTAPTHLLFAQKAALDIINEEGKDNVIKRHEILANTVWKAVDIWSKEGVLKFNVTNKTNRSHAVTTLVAKNFDLLPFKNWIERNTGVELGIGLGFEGPEYHEGNSAFRIAHMGHLNPHMLLGVLASLEMGLIATNIPFKKGGLDNAIDYLANSINDQS
ncbi:aminotransferase class V-fold PLP-dependent enzyme [Paracoccaceae bacterium]|nr:aminotransferase class V-fold PLP-dependent enzyme [Paracoccaceae bacterium]